MPIEIQPDKLNEIAEYLDMGMLCFYNKTNGGILAYPDDLDLSDMEDEWADETAKIEANPDDYFQFEKMSSREAFELMENFIYEVEDNVVRKRFVNSISAKKPFMHFKDMLGNYPVLEKQWYAFKQDYYIKFVQQQVDMHNQELDY